MELDTAFITPIKEWGPVRELPMQRERTGEAGGNTLFKDVLNDVVGQVYSTQQDVERKQVLLASGLLDDAHSLPIAEAKAALSIEVMISLRNKAMESYSELMKMNV